MTLRVQWIHTSSTMIVIFHLNSHIEQLYTVSKPTSHYKYVYCDVDLLVGHQIIMGGLHNIRVFYSTGETYPPHPRSLSYWSHPASEEKEPRCLWAANFSYHNSTSTSTNATSTTPQPMPPPPVPQPIPGTTSISTHHHSTSTTTNASSMIRTSIPMKKHWSANLAHGAQLLTCGIYAC